MRDRKAHRLAAACLVAAAAVTIAGSAAAAPAASSPSPDRLWEEFPLAPKPFRPAATRIRPPARTLRPAARRPVRHAPAPPVPSKGAASFTLLDLVDLGLAAAALAMALAVVFLWFRRRRRRQAAATLAPGPAEQTGPSARVPELSATLVAAFDGAHEGWHLERPRPAVRQAAAPRQLVAAGGGVAVAERPRDLTASYDREEPPARRDQRSGGGQAGAGQTRVIANPAPPSSSDADLLKAKLSGQGGSQATRDLKAKLKRSESDVLKSKSPPPHDRHEAETADDADAALTRATAGAAGRRAETDEPEAGRDADTLAAGAAEEPVTGEAPRPDGPDPAERSAGDDADEELTRAVAAAARRPDSDPAPAHRLARPDESADVSASARPAEGERPRLRPVPSGGAGNPSVRTPAQAQRLGTDLCEIKLWRGYAKAHFFADTGAEKADDQGIVAASPLFRCWLTSEVTEERADAQAALSVLLDRLEDEGWTRVGKGGEWFSTVLRRGQRPR
jgi:hypothetical protein